MKDRKRYRRKSAIHTIHNIHKGGASGVFIWVGGRDCQFMYKMLNASAMGS